ncbi:MAG TPA: DUF2959 domain-containing protein [Candidatus Methylomirabilis sp.]|nr:DUF2959 domain-containing protein [Candidatus Methylomirabilis sp.]
MKFAERLRPITLFALIAAVLAASGCQSAYYATMEKFGVEKRDILVDRVGDAREAQQDAKKQFESALAQFIAVTNFEGGDLQKEYENLKGAYEDSEAKANAVRQRIASVEQVAADLFAEWKKELGEYSNAEMRRTSERQLAETQARYRQLIGAMKAAERKLDPVLAAFHDRVLFLKHNLNARAIASLRTERARVESDITSLIREMNKSIAEADRFIEDMKRPS